MELLEGTYKISADMHRKEFIALDKAIKSAHQIILFHHKGIDADAKGSMLAMYKGIKQKYNKDVHMGGKNDHYELSETDLVILLDVGDLFRINGSYSGNPTVARIDHHPTSFKCDINIEDVSAGSTSELVTLFLKNFDYEINPLVAEMLFKGIIADTGRLQYAISDTTLLALSILKSLNVDYKDIYKRMYVKDNDDLKLRNYILNNYKVSKNGVVYLYLDRERSLDAEIDIDKAGNHLHELGNIKGSPIWVLITDIGKNKITLRLRSRILPINKIAEKYGGGGHENAAAVRVHSKHQAKQILADLDKYLMDEKISGFIKEWNEIENIPYNTLTEQALDNALDEILSETFETHAHKRRMKIINKSIKYLPEDVLNKALPEMKDKSHYAKVKAIRYRIEQLPEDRLNKILNSPAMIQLEANLRKTKRMILGISGGAAGTTTAGAISGSAMTVASYAADYAVAKTLENGLGLAFSIIFGGIFSVGVAALGVLGFTTAGIITATKNKNRVKKAIPDIMDLLKNEHVLVESNISFEFDNISQELIDEMVIYGLTESRLPKDGSDPEFGIPEEEKYPLFNKAHVISAIKLFGHVEDKYEAQLAHAIISKMKKYNISFDMVGEDNRLYKYLSKSELNEKIHWDTILTKPTQLNKNITVYHFSDVKDPNNKVYPFRYTVGNKLSGKYYASWWAENPYDGALYIWFICKSVCNDEKIDKNKIRDYIVNWFAPDNDTPAVYIRKSWWAKYKDKVNKFNIYRYTKTFKVKDLGRGQEYAVVEWTYDDEVIADKVDTMKPIDFLDKTLFIVSDEKFEEVRNKYFTEIVEKGYKTIGDARNKRPWVYYDYNKVKQMTKEIVLEPAYINPKYQHILDNGSSLSPTGFKGFEKKVKDGIEIKFMDASKEIGHAKVCDDYYGDKLSFLHDLEVKKEFRGKGYGTKIMEYLIDKYNIKYLNVDPKNEIAIKLYKKFGFEKTEKVRMNNNKILDRMERQNNLKEECELNESYFSPENIETNLDEWTNETNEILYTILDESRIRNHIKLLKRTGTPNYGDAYDKIYSRLRKKGKSHDEATKIADRYMRKYTEISSPIKPKTMTFNVSEEDYMKAHNISKSDPYDGKSVTITDSNGQTIKFAHGSGKNDPNTPKVNSNDVDHVVSCNARGNGAGKKNVGKGSYPVKMTGERNSDGTISMTVGNFKESDSIDDNYPYNKESKEYINESMFSQENIEINLDEWINGTSGILYITGLSGSGKSTLAKEYKEKYNANLVELDIFFKLAKVSKSEINDVIKAWINKEKLPKDPVFIRVLKTFINTLPDNYFGNSNIFEYSTSEKIMEAGTNFILYAYNKLNNSMKYIFEGTHILEMSPDFFINKPIIIKGTGYLTSTIRALKRDYNPNDTKQNITRFIARIFKMFSKENQMYHQNKNIDNFRKVIQTNKILSEALIKSDKKYDGKTLEVDVEAKLKDKNQKVKIDDTEIEVKKKKGKLELDVEVETDIHAENNKNINYYNNKLPKDIEAARKAGIPNNLAEVIAEAVIELSEKQIGAFITFEKEDNLEKYRKNGEKINAPVSRDIFMTIFYPGTAVHDGAIIIKDGVIKYASVFYENISSDNFAEHYGARHRSAMGISKDTDAVVIVVSEETGRISFAVDGELIVTKPNDVEKNIEKYILTQSLEESTRYKYKKLLNMPEEKRNKLIAEDEAYANAWNRWKDTEKAANLAQDAVIKASIHSQAAKFAEDDKANATTKKEKKKAKQRVDEHYAAKEKHLKKAFKYKELTDDFDIESHPDDKKLGKNSTVFTKKPSESGKQSQISLHMKTDVVKELNNNSDTINGTPFVNKKSYSSGVSVNNQTIRNITGQTLKMKAGKQKATTIRKLKRKNNNS